MTTALTLLLVQGAFGAMDTLWYHEYKLQLSRQPSARKELKLHAYRDFVYAVIFATLAWATWSGLRAFFLTALLAVEIIITLIDFVEEDRSRRVPAGERVMHSIMGFVYGAFLASFVPELMAAMEQPTGFTARNYGWLSFALSAMAVGVIISGIRDWLVTTSIGQPPV